MAFSEEEGYFSNEYNEGDEEDSIFFDDDDDSIDVTHIDDEDSIYLPSEADHRADEARMQIRELRDIAIADNIRELWFLEREETRDAFEKRQRARVANHSMHEKLASEAAPGTVYEAPRYLRPIPEIIPRGPPRPETTEEMMRTSRIRHMHDRERARRQEGVSLADSGFWRYPFPPPPLPHDPLENLLALGEGEEMPANHLVQRSFDLDEYMKRMEIDPQSQADRAVKNKKDIADTIERERALDAQIEQARIQAEATAHQLRLNERKEKMPWEKNEWKKLYGVVDGDEDDDMNPLKTIKPEGVGANLREQNRLLVSMAPFTPYKGSSKDIFKDHPSMKPPCSIAFVQKYVPINNTSTHYVSRSDFDFDNDCWATFELNRLVGPPMPNPFSYIPEKNLDFFGAELKDFTLTMHVVLDIVSNIFRLVQDVIRQNTNLKTLISNKMVDETIRDELNVHAAYAEEILLELGAPLIWRAKKHTSKEKAEVSGLNLMDVVREKLGVIQKNHLDIKKINYTRWYMGNLKTREAPDVVEKRLESSDSLPALSIVYYTILSRLGWTIEFPDLKPSLSDAVEIIKKIKDPRMVPPTNTQFGLMSFDEIAAFWIKYHQIIIEALGAHESGDVLIEEYKRLVVEVDVSRNLVNTPDSAFTKKEKMAFHLYQHRLANAMDDRKKKYQGYILDRTRMLETNMAQGEKLLERANQSFRDTYAVNRARILGIDLAVNVELQMDHLYGITEEKVNELVNVWKEDGKDISRTLNILSMEIGDRTYTMKQTNLKLLIPEKMELAYHQMFEMAQTNLRKYKLNILSYEKMGGDNSGTDFGIISMSNMIQLFRNQLAVILETIDAVGMDHDTIGNLTFHPDGLFYFDNAVKERVFKIGGSTLFSNPEDMWFFSKIVNLLQTIIMPTGLEYHFDGTPFEINLFQYEDAAGFENIFTIVYELTEFFEKGFPLRVIFLKLRERTQELLIHDNLEDLEEYHRRAVFDRFFAIG